MTSEEAIDILKTHYHKNPRTTYGFKVKQATEMAVEALKERKTGKWIYVHPLQEDDGGAYKCSCCSSGSWVVDPTTWRACPWCMALMETERRQEVEK